MSFDHFIPEIWAAGILENFHDAAVVTSLANREYEGQLTSGNTIHIGGIVDVEVKDYKKGLVEDPENPGQTLPRTTVPDTVQDTGLDIKIDNEKSFDFYVDDIDAAQARGVGVENYTQSAGIGLAEDTEQYLTALLTTQGTAIPGTAAINSWTAAYNAVLDVRQALTKAKVPTVGRVLLINAGFERQLLADEGKLTSFDTSGSATGLQEATIGRLHGFQVITSPWLDDTKPTAIGLYRPALAFVSQITKTEALRGNDKFADRVRGLHVYGGGITRPTAVQVYRGA
ncbi:P22 phage major capsid protein family protein [Actinobaculum sp. 352]|uniref:P22 phage major capsid protein family protein n=1 Tax=Actinobaculum sp. 352 TaxID=2490946 RepID=UPI000F7D9A96|nr:P22 phage major capsid protein family protein [Actinobaculum sp. 352]RTE50395.1 hypothetical protein EKN07_04145 [Actinobaculum sp. 352]